jgi:hypothetical protein
MVISFDVLRKDMVIPLDVRKRGWWKYQVRMVISLGVLRGNVGIPLSMSNEGCTFP